VKSGGGGGADTHTGPGEGNDNSLNNLNVVVLKSCLRRLRSCEGEF
jgi:hypothetical protein